jgi:hypothetical protein
MQRRGGTSSRKELQPAVFDYKLIPGNRQAVRTHLGPVGAGIATSKAKSIECARLYHRYDAGRVR